MFGYHGLASSAAVKLDAPEMNLNIVKRLHISRKDIKTLKMEWISGVSNDDLADTVSACAISLEVDPEALTRAKILEEQTHDQINNLERMRIVCLSVLQRHFGSAEQKSDDPNTILINTETLHASVTLPIFSVFCEDPKDEPMVTNIVDMLKSTLLPIKTPGHRLSTSDVLVKIEKTEPSTDMN